MCVDYRELTKRTSKDAYPLPLVDEVQNCLARSRVSTSLDLCNGCWQIQVHASDQHKTALCHEQGLGLFQFTRLPFGLTSAPSSFQQLMDKHFRDLPFVTAHMDYLLIYSASVELHGKHLQEDFCCLRRLVLHYEDTNVALVNIK